MEWNGAFGYAAGLVSGSVGTTLLNHWLGARRDNKQAERDRLAEERAEERERRAAHRTRQLTRLEVIRSGALDLRLLVDEHAAKGVHHDPDDPAADVWIEFFTGLEERRDGEVERALTELGDDRVTSLYSQFDHASFELGSNLASTEEPDIKEHLWHRYNDAYGELVAALNDHERERL